MKKLALQAALSWGFFLTAGCPSFAQTPADSSNRPPAVSISWPNNRSESFSVGIYIKIKANVSDSDGSVAQVQFFAETNLIGVVTNPPFNIVWQVDARGAGYGTWELKAVALDNLGASTEAASVKVYYHTGAPPQPVVEIVSPRSGAVFSAPAAFAFSAEVLASSGDAGPVEFFVGTNSVGLVDQGTPLTATTPPSSINLSNLVEGEYRLTTRYRGANGNLCACKLITNVVRVAKLGVRSPSVTTDGRLQFEVVTSFPGQDTVIQTSSNLVDWLPVNTNRPSSNTFTFTESSPATNAQRFYRVYVPAE